MLLLGEKESAETNDGSGSAFCTFLGRSSRGYSMFLKGDFNVSPKLELSMFFISVNSDSDTMLSSELSYLKVLPV